MRATVMILAAVLMAGFASADLCIVRGFLMAPDGSAAPDSTALSLTETYYDVTYPISTGGPWPYPNFFLQAFRCNIDDTLIIAVDTAKYSYHENMTLSSTVIDVNITLAAKPGGAGSSGGAASGGSGGGSTSQKIPATQGAAVWLSEKETIEIYSYDKWFDITRHIANAYRITGSSIQLVFSDGPDIVLKLGENATLDLNKDGFAELTVSLDALEGKRAYVSFIRNTDSAVVEPPDERVEQPTNSTAPAAPASGSQEPAKESPESSASWFSKRNVLMLIIIVDLLVILVIEIRRRRK